MLYTAIFSFLLGSAAAFSFTEPTPYLRKYAGNDKGRPCFLWVHQETGQEKGHEKEEGNQYQVEVSTSYEHQGQGLGKVELVFSSPENPKLLEWSHEATGEFLRVLLNQPELSLKAPKAFRLKWLHFDHLHDSTCSDLKEVTVQ